MAKRKVILTNTEVIRKTSEVSLQIKSLYPRMVNTEVLKCYAVPRGGIPVAYMLRTFIPNMLIVDDPEDANFMLDDLIDSGKTKQRLQGEHQIPFFALYNKKKEFEDEPWLVFPWEQKGEDSDETVEDNITRIIQYVGDDPAREGLIETPKRVIKAYKTLFSVF